MSILGQLKKLATTGVHDLVGSSSQPQQAQAYANGQSLTSVNQPAPSKPQLAPFPNQYLGYRPGAVDMPSQPVYAPKQLPTPSFSLPTPNLQRYGDNTGNQWLENEQGQRFQIAQPKANFDAPVANQNHQFLRPGTTGYLPVDDATVHNIPRAKRPLPRVTI